MAETDAALSREGALEEDSMVSSLHIPVVMLGVISLEIVLMTYGFVYPALRAYLEGMISRLPIDSSSTGFLVRGLPTVLTLLSQVAAYLSIALWLVSFAEAAVFLYNAMGAGSGKFGWRGVVRSLTARPFQIMDMGVMLLNGPIVFLTSTNTSEWESAVCEKCGMAVAFSLHCVLAAAGVAPQLLRMGPFFLNPL